MNALLLQIHRYIGLATLLFLLIAGATGAVLVVDKPLDAMLNPSLFHVDGATANLSPLAAAASFGRAHPATMITQAPLRLHPDGALELQVSAWPGAAPLAFDQVFLDPRTGRTLGVRRDTPGFGPRHLMRGLYFLHYTLLAGDVGRWFMAAVALAWFLNNFVGFYLTLPKGPPFWRRWKPVWGVNFKARLGRLLLDLHRASGLWLSLALLVTAFTSVALNTYSELIAPAATALSPPRIAPWDRLATPRPPGRRPKLDLAAAEQAALPAARAHRIGLVPAALTYDGERNLYGLRFTSDGWLDWRGLGPVSIYVDGDSGRLVYLDDPRTDSAGQKFLRSLYPLHSGEVGGWATRLLALLVGLATVEMSLSGIYVWWKKRRPRVAARATKRAERHQGRLIRTAS